MRRREKGNGGNGKPTNGKFPDKMMESRSALEELASIAEQKAPVSNKRFFELVKAFAKEKRKHGDALMEMEKTIREAYSRFTLRQREDFFSMLYDEFAGNYDEHMSMTGHYDAIRNVLFYAGPHLRSPLLDITAGTGEPLKYVMEYMKTANEMRASDTLERKFSCLLPVLPDGTADSGEFYANEISPKMLAKAEAKLAGSDVAFTRESAYDLPEDYAEKFSTVLCCQTFHLIPDEDKAKLVISMNEALEPGGVAVVIEEDPFTITPTPHIEPVSLFIRSVAAPIRYPATLIAYFENNGFTKLEDRAVAPIDSEHAMRLHLFMKYEARLSVGYTHEDACSSPG